MNIKIFSNVEGTEFAIGFENMDFDSTSDMALSGVCSLQEKEISKLQREFGAKTTYFEINGELGGQEVDRERYEQHLEEYNNDEWFIIPKSIFNSENQANDCLQWLWCNMVKKTLFLLKEGW